jgi:hypothetical protein
MKLSFSKANKVVMLNSVITLLFVVSILSGLAAYNNTKENFYVISAPLPSPSTVSVSDVSLGPKAGVVLSTPVFQPYVPYVSTSTATTEVKAVEPTKPMEMTAPTSTTIPMVPTTTTIPMVPTTTTMPMAPTSTTVPTTPVEPIATVIPTTTTTPVTLVAPITTETTQVLTNNVKPSLKSVLYAILSIILAIVVIGTVIFFSIRLSSSRTASNSFMSPSL